MSRLLSTALLDRLVNAVLELSDGISRPGSPVTSVAELRSWLESVGEKEDVGLRGMARLIDAEWRDPVGTFPVYPDFISWYPISLARRVLILAGDPDNGKIPVLVGSFAGLDQMDYLRRRYAAPLRLIFSPGDLVLSEINRAWQQRKSETRTNIESLDKEQSVDGMKIMAGGEDLLATTGKSPIIRLANSLIFDAIQVRASDIHIQPYESHLQIRFRIDGVLFDQFELPRENQEEILSRVKVMGKMNIAEKRLPQDGRATVCMGDRNIDLRIASLPTSHGERIVIRLLDKGAMPYTLEELGMTKTLLEKFRRLIHREHGLFLVTGPTGGGKSTTLYAALQELNVKDRNVVTLEDPIEYQLPGISQTQVNEKKGMTFATGLRNVLRQDPDVIMIGEIRDRETAEMAIQSALTGHMVYSTLHTNDSTSAVTRLLDLGIEPYLVASSLSGVLAQRLVRRICNDCRVPAIGPDDVAAAGAGDSAFTSEGLGWRGSGCDKCRGTGYFGRIGVFEMVTIDDDIRSLIQKQSNASEIRNLAKEKGMHPLRMDGLEKVSAGKTTLEEVLRVSMELGE